MAPGNPADAAPSDRAIASKNAPPVESVTVSKNPSGRAIRVLLTDIIASLALWDFGRSGTRKTWFLEPDTRRMAPPHLRQLRVSTHLLGEHPFLRQTASMIQTFSTEAAE